MTSILQKKMFRIMLNFGLPLIQRTLKIHVHEAGSDTSHAIYIFLPLR